MCQRNSDPALAHHVLPDTYVTSLPPAQLTFFAILIVAFVLLITEKLRNDVAIGASWTSSTKITLNLEYHYHQAGLSNQDWKNWFDIGAANASRQPVTAELWYLRGFAGAQQQPLTRHQAFLRADWPDAFVVHLELTALAFVNLYDGSTLGQLSASYDVSDAWTLRAYVSANLGGKRSERGSVPQAASAILQLVRYF